MKYLTTEKKKLVVTLIKDVGSSMIFLLAMQQVFGTWWVSVIGGVIALIARWFKRA